MYKRKQKYYWHRAYSREQVYRPQKTFAQSNSRRKKEISRAKLLVLTAFFAAAALWFIYFFLFSDNFRVIDVRLIGLSNIPTAEMNAIVQKNLSRRRFLIFPNGNIWLFSKERLQSDIAQKYIVEELKIDKRLPFGLSISVKEKLARLVLRALSEIKVAGEPAGERATSTDAAIAEPVFTESYFYLDVNGLVVSAEQNMPEQVLAQLPVIQITYAGITPVKPGDSVMNREKIAYVQALYEEFGRAALGVKIDYVNFDPNLDNELKIATKEGWQILISTKLAAADQAKKLELALNEKIKDYRPRLQYVDLRVNDRVYYK